jgi:hypothetical protein
MQNRANRVVSRASLLEDVWRYSYTGGSNVVDAVIRTLRRKLGDHASAIETVKRRRLSPARAGEPELIVFKRPLRLPWCL